MRFLSAVEGLIVDHHTRGVLTVIPFHTMDDKESGLKMASVPVVWWPCHLGGGALAAQGAGSFRNNPERGRELPELQPPTVPAVQHKLECVLLHLAKSAQLRTGNVGVLHPTLTDREGRNKAKEVEPCFGFQTVSLEGWLSVGSLPPSSFSFIVITKYTPMMENYGFLLAIWQLCLSCFFSFWLVCISNPLRLEWGGIMRLKKKKGNVALLISG